MIVSLRVAAIAGVWAVVASTYVEAQTTGTFPPSQQPYEITPASPPPATGQFSPNELIDAGNRRCGSYPLRYRSATGSQSRLSEVHRDPNVEPILTAGKREPTEGHDTRALQAYLGHKNIQHTVRYTELSPLRFKDFWRS
jgi:hypothetical protein